MSRLTEGQRQEIMDLLLSPRAPSQDVLAAEYGVSQATISRLLKRAQAEGPREIDYRNAHLQPDPDDTDVAHRLDSKHQRILEKLERVAMQDESPIVTQEFREQEANRLRKAMEKVGPTPDPVEEERVEDEEALPEWSDLTTAYPDHLLIRAEQDPVRRMAIRIAFTSVEESIFRIPEKVSPYIDAIYDDIVDMYGVL